MTTKPTLKIMFLTLFLDLVGFSIIFPMFPALAKYYLDTDAQNPILQGIFSLIHTIMAAGGADTSVTPIVLFGGILGAIYSLLQFVSAPFWGKLSDRIGRKPVLLMSVAGLAISYLLWFFSGSFTLLVLARFVGGIMGGNMSTATAVVADVTGPDTRAKGMAYIGIAFALGFIIGPALGGIVTLYNPLVHHPEWAAVGINPFSTAALVAFVLSVINLFMIARRFTETLPPRARQTRPAADATRSANIVKLFKPLPYRGVNRTNLAYFFFLFIFSGMEFTLTFLAFERLAYSPMQNAYMFIFIGIVLSLIQGGVVRRHAHKVGEKRMVLVGLILVIPGLVILALAQSTAFLYSGLSFLAIGSAMIIPCLTTLVSMYAPLGHQGHVIGVFRSLGALARAIGPFIASVVYWRFGSMVPYLLGAAGFLLPILLVARLPKPIKEETRTI